MKKAFLLGLSLGLLITSGAQAEVRLPKLVSDGMVLQRDTQVPVWGWADAGEAVAVEFRGESYLTQANEEGEWRINLPEMSAGGPFELIVKGDNQIILEDVLVGDVWLASGQSNMELTMARLKPLYADLMAEADYPQIRYFDVPDRYNFAKPLPDLEGGHWLTVNPETIGSVSGVVFFFARELHRTQEVPIGIVNSALGGSPVEAWISEPALKQFPRAYQELQKFKDEDYVSRLEEDDQQRIAAWHEKAREQDAGTKGDEYLWADPNLDTDDWNTMQVPGYWPLADDGPVNGIVWARTEVDIPAELAGKPARLEVGRIVDADITFVNGTRVGSTGYQYPPRRYTIPEGVLRAGRNTLAVRISNEQGRGGFLLDKPYELEIGDTLVDLKGEWRYKVAAQMPPLAPPTFIRWKPTGLYNGMIAPLTNIPFTGTIWYQGESNTYAPDEYALTFPAMIADWRKQWNRPELPFLYVQLANFMEPKDQPEDSNWARTREAQLETLAVPNTAMAVTIDVGEWNDIHPLNKKAVGERLAAAARHEAYGEKLVYSGPLYKAMAIQGNKIVLSFDHVNGGLVAKDGELQEFAIAGADGNFVWAKAEIRGDKIVVWSDEVAEPVAVRYAWADNPDDANLYNKAGFPASPFRTDDW